MIVRTEDLSFAYNGEPVFSNVNLAIPENDFVGLIGPNGSGKTTLAKLLLGLLKPSTGSIKLFGADSAKFKAWNKMGYVPQRYTVDKNFPGTVQEVLALKDAPRSGKVWALLGIDVLLSKKFSELSGGQQQKVLIALALASRPKLLILDEPDAGIDAKGQQDFYALLKRINEEHKVTIILITHDVGLVSRYVKTVVCLNKTVCCTGPARETKRLVREIYGKNFEIFHHREGQETHVH